MIKNLPRHQKTLSHAEKKAAEEARNAAAASNEVNPESAPQNEPVAADEQEVADEHMPDNQPIESQPTVRGST